MRIEDLERELRAERPELDPEFARKLDDWAAAGFPRGGELDQRVRGRAGSGFLGLGAVPRALRSTWERLTAVPPRRILAPAGAAATLIVVGAVAVSQLDDRGGTALSGPSRDTGALEQVQGGGAEAAKSAGEAQAPAPESEARSGDADAAAGAIAPDEGAPVPLTDSAADGISRGAEDRLKDATARISLGAEADEVQEVANGVVSVTDRHDGIVLNSQVTSDQGGARASFELEIPFTELDAALTDLSELGDVISRTEAEEDITDRAVRAQRDLANAREKISKLRIELIEADTRKERLVIKSQISSLDAQADAYEAQLKGVKREAHFASVSVDVTSNGPDTDEGGWGIDDAIDDAGAVLETIGGIALISLAILLPLGLVAALAYWLITAARNASRERALDQG